MQKRILLIFCFLLFTGCFPLSTGNAVEGQVGQEIAFLELGVGARPLGMGGSFVSAADDANAIYWNPAGLSGLDRRNLTSMHTKLFLDTKYYYLSFASPISTKYGSLGCSWMQLACQDIKRWEPVLDENGEPVIDPVTNKPKVEFKGYIDSTDNAYYLGYGRKLGEKISTGVNLKYIHRKLADTAGKGLGVDAGVIYKPIKSLSVGLVGQDITQTKIKWDTNTNDTTRTNIKMGVAYRLLFKKSKLPSSSVILAGDISQKLKKKHNPIYHLGIEWLIAEMVALRIGWDDNSLTAGCGFMMNLSRAGLSAEALAKADISADYAYVTNADFDNTHRISLSVRF